MLDREANNVSLSVAARTRLLDKGVAGPTGLYGEGDLQIQQKCVFTLFHGESLGMAHSMQHFMRLKADRRGCLRSAVRTEAIVHPGLLLLGRCAQSGLTHTSVAVSDTHKPSGMRQGWGRARDRDEPGTGTNQGQGRVAVLTPQQKRWCNRDMPPSMPNRT